MSEIATDYMEGKLPLVRRLRARRHLLLCEACRRYYDQLRRTVALLAGGGRTPPPAAVEDKILAAVKAEASRD